jgi:hypothetical protein
LIGAAAGLQHRTGEPVLERFGHRSAARRRVARPPISMRGSPSPSARTAPTDLRFRCCSRNCATRGCRCRRPDRCRVLTEQPAVTAVPGIDCPQREVRQRSRI